MLVGTTVDPRSYDRLLTYPGTQLCRVFGYSGRGLPAWKPTTGDARIEAVRGLAPAAQPACVFQDWPDDTAVKARINLWLNDVDIPARLCWRHEADRKKEPIITYRRRWYLLASWVADHPNGHLVTLTPTQTYQWTMADAEGKGRGDWSRYYTGIGNTSVDVYADSWRPDYPNPAAFLAPLWRYRDVIGRDLEIPEFGAARVGYDRDGAARAEWLVACAQIMRSEGVTAVCYWDDLGTGGTDLRLWADNPDTLEAQAWRAVITDNTVTVPAPAGESGSLGPADTVR